MFSLNHVACLKDHVDNTPTINWCNINLATLHISSSEILTCRYKEDERLKESDRVKIFQLNSTLMITSAEEDDVGTYKCEVINDTLVEKIPPQSFRVICELSSSFCLDIVGNLPNHSNE